jgi:hypothetical protein
MGDIPEGEHRLQNGTQMRNLNQFFVANLAAFHSLLSCYIWFVLILTHVRTHTLQNGSCGSTKPPVAVQNPPISGKKT